MKSRDLISLKCLYCDKIYQLAKHRFQDYKKKGKLNGCFCSRMCVANYKQKTMNVKTNCSECNKEIVKLKNQFNKSLQHFCSSSCSAKYWNKIKWPIEKRHIPKSVNKSYMVSLQCKNCNKIFERRSYSVNKNSDHHFCSNSCVVSYGNRTWNKSSRFGFNKSRSEIILSNIIKKEFPHLIIQENIRSIVPNSLELDIYIPDKKIAIELNGPCHFIPLFGKEELNKTQTKDSIKIKYCQENDIKLLIINVMGLRNQEKTLNDIFVSQIKPLLLN